jgi:CBS domain-containing protein
VHVIDIMTAPAVTTTPTTSVRAALRTLAALPYSSLPVVEDGDRLVGIVSEQDLLRRVLEPNGTGRARWADPGSADEGSLVEQVMTRRPHTTTTDAEVSQVAHTFSLMPWRSLPVVQHGRLVGIVSCSDVVRALSREDEAVRRDVQTLFTSAGRPHLRARVSAGVVEVSGAHDDAERAAASELASSVVGVRRVHHRSVTPGQPVTTPGLTTPR